MTKITPEHLAREAVVYVRQLTVMQVVQNLESQRRQYGLADRARQLGWADVEVIDDDLGRSGGGARRPGFEKLLAAICEGRVGAVLSLEASRLARNGRDWHTLLEFCGLVGTLIVDEDGVYDPASPNDRLLLGMKGTMSEMELSVFRQRSIEAMKQKARRGELFLTVAVGYVKAGGDLSRKTRTGASRPPSHWCSANSPSFRRFARFWCGAGKRRSVCPLWARVGLMTGLSGACLSIRRSTTCSPTRSMPVPMPSAAEPRA
jgi:DNA invertase Pin-like site-specific DNA recombinase